MKVPFLQIVNRITGFSTPIFGLSWNPPNLEIESAKRLLTFLEDRRVLYTPVYLEQPIYVVDSVLEIRTRLTKELEHLDRSTLLAESIAFMRGACRKFLDQVEKIELAKSLSREDLRRIDYVIFFSALGELRGAFGVHIARIAVRYGIDVEEELATTLPALPDTGKSKDGA